MATHLFAFNPSIWSWPSLADDIRTLARRGHLDTEWSCGRFRHIEPGSRAFLVRLGVPPKGLIGSGVVMTAPAEGPHWIDAKKAAGVPARYVMLRLDALFDRPLIGFDELDVPPWRRFRWGRTAEVFILDCRSERRPSTRSTNPPNSSTYISLSLIHISEPTRPY